MVLPSSQYSNNLYHFAPEPKWILKALEDRYFIANYNPENFAFLNIEPISTLHISMVCFCDIPLDPSRIKPHLKRYGSFGIGLTKEWGMRNGVNPVHYIIPSSPCATDFQRAFRAAKTSKRINEKKVATLANYLVTQLAYFKPVQDSKKCYEDECEWRFVPEKTSDWNPALPELTNEELKKYREAQLSEESIRLHFSYDDITHLLAPKEAGIEEYLDAINRLELDDSTKDILKTKIHEVSDSDDWQL